MAGLSASLRDAASEFRAGQRRHRTIEGIAFEKNRTPLWSGGPDARSMYANIGISWAVGVAGVLGAWLNPAVPSLAFVLGPLIAVGGTLVVMLTWREREYAVFDDGFWIKNGIGKGSLRSYKFTEFGVVQVRHRLIAGRFGLVDLEFFADAKRRRGAVLAGVPAQVAYAVHDTLQEGEGAPFRVLETVPA